MDLSINLCKACLDLLELKVVDVRVERGLGLPHHASISDLLAAVQARCRFCCAFWNSYSDEDQRTLRSANSVRASRLVPPWEHDEVGEMHNVATRCNIWPGNHPEWGHGTGTLIVSIVLHQDLGQKCGLGLAEQRFLFVPTNAEQKEGCHQSSLGGGFTKGNQVIASSTSSPECCNLIEKWLRDCFTKHRQCNVLHDSGWRPSRLLEISGTESVRVVETAQEPTRGHYMSLSHRWCASPTLVLSRESEGQLKAGIHRSSLPQAVQDAVPICRRLEIPYLWVDLLCIRQNDEDLHDWKKESATMDKVYGNSLLNLVALAAENTTHTFFVARDPDQIKEMYIGTFLDETLEVATEPKMYRVVDLDLRRREVNNLPLNCRGWVVQERLLSPRSVYFGRDQIHWECREQMACETYPDEMISSTDELFKVNPNPQSTKLQVCYHTRSESLSDQYRLWDRVVAHYTRCGLTRDEDKLVALSGIANMMQRLLGDTYIAGMWRGDLETQLLWTVSYHTGNNLAEPWFPRRYASYIAPSFSWASIDGAIRPFEKSHAGATAEPLIEVKSVDLVRPDDNPTGSVTGGSLTLRCRLQEIEMKPGFPFTGGFEPHLKKIIKHDTTEQAYRTPVLILMDENTNLFNPGGRQDLYAVPVLHQKTSATSSDLYHLLLQVVDKENGVFRRIGVTRRFFQYSEDNDREAERRDLAMWTSESPDAEELPCVASDGGSHTIRIV